MVFSPGSLILTDLIRYNKGDEVLGMEFGDHIGDW
jgi:hypothetical protein